MASASLSRSIVLLLIIAANVFLTDATCFDGNAHCAAWAAKGECQKNPLYMATICGLSCRTCVSSSCVDTDLVQCPLWAQKGECHINPNYMLNHCRRSCNNCVAYYIIHK